MRSLKEMIKKNRSEKTDLPKCEICGMQELGLPLFWSGKNPDPFFS